MSSEAGSHSLGAKFAYHYHTGGMAICMKSSNTCLLACRYGARIKACSLRYSMKDSPAHLPQQTSLWKREW